MNTRTRRTLTAVTGLLAASAFAAAGAATVVAKSATRTVTGTAYVGETHAAGSVLYQAGSTSDNVLGAGALLFATGTSVTKPGVVHIASTGVTLYTATGSLSGSASADINVTSGTQATVTNGTLNLTSGKGSQKGHSLTATFTGTGNPTTLQYVFNYKGTYK